MTQKIWRKKRRLRRPPLRAGFNRPSPPPSCLELNLTAKRRRTETTQQKERAHLALALCVAQVKLLQADHRTHTGSPLIKGSSPGFRTFRTLFWSTRSSFRPLWQFKKCVTCLDMSTFIIYTWHKHEHTQRRNKVVFNELKRVVFQILVS